MTFFHKTGTAFLAISASAFATPAMAQESGTTSATAEFYSEEPPVLRLSVSGGQTLRFGRVRVPNGTRPGSKCEYNLSVGSGGATSGQVTTLTSYREVDSSGSVVGSNDPEATECGWSAVDEDPGTANAGSFRVECTIGESVNYLVKVTGGLPGVFFASPLTGRAITSYAINPITNSVGQPIDTSNFTSTCPNSDDTLLFADQGELEIFVGGQLTIAENAEVSDGAINVGTITLEASY